MRKKIFLYILVLAVVNKAAAQVSFECYDKQMTKVKTLYEQKSFKQAQAELIKIDNCTNKRENGDRDNWSRILSTAVEKNRTKTGNYNYVAFKDKKGEGVYFGYLKNNKRNGDGLMGYDDGSTYFGEWVDNEFIWGTYYNSDSTFSYTGQYKDGIIHGWGTMYWGVGDSYEGETAGGFRNGWGTYTWKNGSKYTGQWLNNTMNGFGHFVMTAGQAIVGCPDAKMYCGYMRDDKKEGIGRCYDKDNRIIYDGAFKNDLPVEKFPNRDFKVRPNSQRTQRVVLSNGRPVTQEVIENEIDGLGLIYYTDTSSYAGEWHKGMPEGQGKLVDGKHSEYNGGYRAGFFYGWGRTTRDHTADDEGEYDKEANGWYQISWKDGNTYEGMIKQNTPNGFGKLYYVNGFEKCQFCNTYIGEFKEGKFAGRGRCYDKDMRLVYDGYFVNDAPTEVYPNQ